MKEEIIEIGKKCTVFPDSNLQYEITNVRYNRLIIKTNEATTTTGSCDVDLKNVENPKLTIEKVSIDKINLIKGEENEKN